MHLKNKIEQLGVAPEYKIAKRCVTDFRNLPLARALVEEIKKVRDQEESVLKSEDDTRIANFNTEVV